MIKSIYIYIYIYIYTYKGIQYRQTLSALRGSYRAEVNGGFKNPRFYNEFFFTLFFTSPILLHPVVMHFKRFIQSELIPQYIIY